MSAEAQSFGFGGFDGFDNPCSFAANKGSSYSKGIGKSSYISGFSKGSANVTAQKPKAEKLNYNVGQMVEHNTFGRGMVLKVTPMGSDLMLEIAFDTVGTKKLMAAYAKLKII